MLDGTPIRCCPRTNDLPHAWAPPLSPPPFSSRRGFHFVEHRRSQFEFGPQNLRLRCLSFIPMPSNSNGIGAGGMCTNAPRKEDANPLRPRTTSAGAASTLWSSTLHRLASSLTYADRHACHRRWYRVAGRGVRRVVLGVHM